MYNKSNMKFTIVTLAVIFCFTWITPLNALSMEGGGYQIIADSFSFTSVDQATGGDYAIFSTGGEVGATSTVGGNAVLRGGFAATNQGILRLTLSSDAINLGALSEAAVASANLIATVSTDSQTGYTLSLTEDGNLRDASGNDINDVSDGAVDAGQEEYGIRTVGPDGLLAIDQNLYPGNRNVAAAAGIVTNRATTISFRASRSNATAAGSYSHRVTFTLTVNP